MSEQVVDAKPLRPTVAEMPLHHDTDGASNGTGGGGSAHAHPPFVH